MFGFTKSAPVMTNLEQMMYTLIETMVKSPDCVIEIDPEDMSYMLSIDDESYYLSIDGIGVQFSNHGFVIVKSYSAAVLDHYKTLVKTETTTRRKLRRAEIFKNEGNLIVGITEKISSKSLL